MNGECNATNVQGKNYNLHKLQGGHVPQCPIAGDATGDDYDCNSTGILLLFDCNSTALRPFDIRYDRRQCGLKINKSASVQLA